MLRKLTLAITASVALGAAALAPTAASARWHGDHGGHGGHGGHGWHRPFVHHGFIGGPRFAYGGPAYIAGNPCFRTRWVPTPWGPRLRRVNVCY
jgi:hypothetical protein